MNTTTAIATVRTAARRAATPKPEEALPYSEMSERGLLGSLIVGSNQFDVFSKIEGRVSPQDFLNEDFGQLFAALKTIHGGGLPVHDPKVLLTELPKLRVPPQVYTFTFLRYLIEECGLPWNVEFYAEEIRSAAQKREIIFAAARAIKIAYSPTSEAHVVISSLVSDLERIQSRSITEIVGLDEAMREVAATARDELERPVRSACGWSIPSIDAAVGLLMRGELVVVGAQPGSGKTAFAMQVAVHAAKTGKRTFFASLEMQSTELAERELCRAVDLDSRKLRAGAISADMVSRLEAAANLDESPVRIWSPPSATLAEIRGMAKHEHAKSKLSLVIVDYIQLAEASADDRRETREVQVGNVANGLRKLAKELNCTVLALSQLNRGEKNAPPTLASLRQSGQIEQAANVVLFLHPSSARQPDAPMTMEAIVAKVRAGEIGKVNLTFHPKETRFTEPTAMVQAPAERRYKEFE